MWDSHMRHQWSVKIVKCKIGSESNQPVNKKELKVGGWQVLEGYQKYYQNSIIMLGNLALPGNFGKLTA